ncbi:MAG: hypothetical protein LC802_23380 [Acidobacteria bacterium]|nr:hypothetical protein [Acidobacteriota bacterium]
MKTLTVGKGGVAAPLGIEGRRREHLFYTGMAAAIVLTVFAGFARTYYLGPYFGARALSPLWSGPGRPSSGRSRERLRWRGFRHSPF